MPNTHGTPDTLKEWQAIGGDLLPACLLTSSGMTPPGSGLTLAAAACTAYARSASDLVYIAQPAVSVTLPNVDGSHWLIAHRDTHSAVASWTRRAGSHFLTLQSATQPTIPDGAVLVAQLTVAGGNLTAVDTTPALSPPLSRQTADAVAITGGAISVGGHAPTGVLDVQGSVQASDAANNYYSVRVWPVAPSGAGNTRGIRIETPTGAGVSGAPYAALQVLNPPAMGINTTALDLQVSSGTNRYNVFAGGTAQNYFAGNVGIGMAPSYPLDVTGQARVTGKLGLGVAPTAFDMLQILHNQTVGALRTQPSGEQNPNYTIIFTNAAGGTVGHISQTATGVAFNNVSDRRLKRNVQPLTDALATLRQLRPVSFRWNVDDSSGIGFLAHEAQAVIPESVTGLPDQVDSNGQIIPQGMDHSKLVPWLVGALQEVTQRLEALESALGV